MLKRDVFSYKQARQVAKRRLPRMVFDYVDGAAGYEFGQAHNRQELQNIRLSPRILKDVRQRKTKTALFGEQMGLPFGITPMGMCNLVDPHADRYLAEFAARNKVPVGVSTVASSSLEDMAKWSEGHAWFQLYYTGQWETSKALLDRAQQAGYKTLILTVDVPEIGIRPREAEHKYTYPFKMTLPHFIDFACHPFWAIPMFLNGAPDLGNFGGKFGEFDRAGSRAGADWGLLEKIRAYWQGNLVVKGVLNVKDAVKLQQYGVDAIQVSSHGSRQLDSAPAPINCLKAIRQAVGDDMVLLYDSGIRDGEDIIKAYAYGANFVFVGRGFSYAIAANGAKGLAQYGALLDNGVSIALAQLGVNDIADVDGDCLHEI